MKQNYTNYSKPGFTPVESKEIPEDAAPEQIEVTQLETVEPEVEDTMIPVAEVIEQVIAEELGNVEPEEPIKPEPKTGVVTANKLNIRKLPAPTAEVVTVVDKNAKLMIDPEYETVEWFKVCTAAGIEGYCMKKFVEVK